MTPQKVLRTLARGLIAGLPWVAGAFFVGCIALAVTAGFLGADPDLKWGPFRKIILILGILGLAGLAFLRLIKALDARLLSHAEQIPNGMEAPIGPTARADKSKLEGSDLKQDTTGGRGRGGHRWTFGVVLALVFVLVGFVYVGLVSVWHFTYWPPTTGDYSMLADAFIHGKTYLPLQPPPELASVPDPYSAAGRHGIKVIGDLSYFNGKYYLYWGPSPAVVLAGLRMLGLPPMGDQGVVFWAVLTVFIFSVLSLFRLREALFPDIPPWLLLTGVIVVATSHPTLWTLNSPTIYTAAIAGGQAFLVAGVYFWIRALTRVDGGGWNFGLAGLLWGLSIASRLTTAMSVLILLAGTIILLARRARFESKWRAEGLKVVFLLAALLLVMAGYGEYNLLRFGNIFETGFRFQLTTLDKTVQFSKGTLFTGTYLFPNILYHFLAPTHFIRTFPFVRAVYGQYPPFTQFLAKLRTPADFGVGATAGLIFAMPTVFFAGTYARRLVLSVASGPDSEGELTAGTSSRGPSTEGRFAIGAILLFAALAGSLPVLLYSYAASRYDFDFVPILAIVVVLGMWQRHTDTRQLPIQGRLVNLAIVLLVVTAAAVSFLLGVSGAVSRFDDLNPALFAYLVHLFSW